MAKDDRGHGSEKRGGRFPRKERIRKDRAEAVYNRREAAANRGRSLELKPKNTPGMKKAAAAVHRRKRQFGSAYREYKSESQ